MKWSRACSAALLALGVSVLAGEDPLDPLERQMAQLVNRERAGNKVPPLTYHKGLAAVAQAHSLDMKTNRFFSHESKRTGRVKDRVTKAGIPNRGVGENLARGGSVESCHQNLMLSPKHKENILRPTFTHIGIGFARDATGLLLCTQVFMRVTPAYDVGKVRQEIIDGINKTRLAKGLRRLLPDDVLTRQALNHSERAARIGRADPLWLERELRNRDRRWRMHQAGYFLTDDPSHVTSSGVAQSTRPTHLGVGVVQSPLRSKEAGALWVTLICAQKK